MRSEGIIEIGLPDRRLKVGGVMESVADLTSTSGETRPNDVRR